MYTEHSFEMTASCTSPRDSPPRVYPFPSPYAWHIPLGVPRMSPHPTPQLTQCNLTSLHRQLGSWEAVAKHLKVSEHWLTQQRIELGIPPRHRAEWKRPTSSLMPWKDQIAALAAKGMTCPEIVRELDLPVQAEQVRRFLHANNLPLLARRGAQPGAKHRDWKGGRIVDKTGYILVRQLGHPHANSGGYVREHRLVMEQHLGRYLEPNEVVHHINGDKADNRIENLEVFESNGVHLAKTLKGHCPNWSDEGHERILEAVRRQMR